MKRFKRLRRPQKLALLLVSLIAVLSATIVPAYAGEDAGRKGAVPDGIFNNTCNKKFPFNTRDRSLNITKLDKRLWLSAADDDSVVNLKRRLLLKDFGTLSYESKKRIATAFAIAYARNKTPNFVKNSHGIWQRADVDDFVKTDSASLSADNGRRTYDFSFRYDPGRANQSAQVYQMFSVIANNGTLSKSQRGWDRHNQKYWDAHGHQYELKYMWLCIGDHTGFVYGGGILDGHYVWGGAPRTRGMGD